jgi:MFS family permease
VPVDLSSGAFSDQERAASSAAAVGSIPVSTGLAGIRLSADDIQTVIRSPDFLKLAASGALAWAGVQISLVALTWLTFQETRSPVSVGLVMASLLAAYFVLGLPFGSLTDSIDRRLAIIGADGARLLAYLVLALASGRQGIGLGLIVVAVFAIGGAMAVRTIASQTLIFVIAGPRARLTAIALSLLGIYLLGAAGSVVGGVVLGQFGARATFATAAFVTMLGMAPVRQISVPVRATDTPGAFSPRGALQLIRTRRGVRLTFLLIVLGEFFGFSSGSVLPVLAGGVYQVGPSGLGVMTGTFALGAVLGVAVVATIGSRGNMFIMLPASVLAFGIGLLGLSVASAFLLSLPCLLLTGAAGAGLDSLGQAILQSDVKDQERGAALGVWVFAVGFGPAGYLTMGFLAAQLGVSAALVVSAISLAIGVFAIGRPFPSVIRSG